MLWDELPPGTGHYDHRIERERRDIRLLPGVAGLPWTGQSWDEYYREFWRDRLRSDRDRERQRADMARIMFGQLDENPAAIAIFNARFGNKPLSKRAARRLRGKARGKV